jgi:hypothetical protein
MTLTRSVLGLFAALAVGAAACTDYDSGTNLHPDGPPMVEQVLMKELRTDAAGNTSIPKLPSMVFGTHPSLPDDRYPTLGANTVTTVPVINNQLRVVMDELLVGSYLEEIACRGPVDNDSYDFIPVGTTPEDVAKCAAAKDVLPSTCPASMSHSMCICKISGGCGSVEEGQPVGVLDVNEDGAADDTRLIAGSVGLQCGPIAVPIDQNLSYWYPSGNQEPIAGIEDPFNQLGPAIVISPQSLPPYNGALPTGQDCQLTFAADVVDKTNIQVCAPADGDILGDCTPGDLSAFKFTTQPFTIKNTSFQSGATGVSRTAPVILLATAPVDATTVMGSITVTGPGNTPVTNFTITEPMPQTIRIAWGGGALPATTMYTLTISSGLHDSYGLPVQPVTFTFTTGA